VLNEVQQQRQKLASQVTQMQELRQQFAGLQEVNRVMQSALADLQSKESPVSMR